jgi:phage terminase Nu1 subunit (DNA packaging protein)
MSLVVGRNEIAAVLGVSPRHINNLVAEGLPHTSDGTRVKYPVPECVAWWVRRAVEKAAEKAAPVDEWDAKARVDALRADMLEIDLAERLGQVMTVDQYQKARTSADARVAAKLKALENRLAPVVVGTRDIPDAIGRVRPLLTEVMDELYRGEDVPTDVEPDAESDADTGRADAPAA